MAGVRLWVRLANARASGRGRCCLGDEAKVPAWCQGASVTRRLVHSPCAFFEQVDVYAFAVVLWELVTGDIPYLGMAMMDVVSGVVHKNMRPPIPTYCLPGYLFSVVCCCCR